MAAANPNPPSASVELARCAAKVYSRGLTTTSGGNISTMTEDGTLYITPSGTDKGAMKAEDVVWLRWAGSEWESAGSKVRPSVEFPVHQAVYAARADIRALVHAHPPSVVALAICGVCPDDRVLHRAMKFCHGIVMAPYALPGSQELSRVVVQAFGGESRPCCVVMASHGIIVGAPNLNVAFLALEAAEAVAALTLRTIALTRSPPLPLLEPVAGSGTIRVATRPDGANYGPVRQLMCGFLRRCLDHRLMCGFSGVITVKLADDLFLTTPSGDPGLSWSGDRADVTPESVVLIASGADDQDIMQCSNGYLGDEAAKHIAILKHQKSWGATCVMSSECLCNTMAFSAGSQPVIFDPFVIPEGFISVRNVKSVPISALSDVSSFAQLFAQDSPVVVVAHSAVYTVGVTPLQAFDRLEVTEAIARAQIDAASAGLLVHSIAPRDITDLRQRFPL